MATTASTFADEIRAIERDKIKLYQQQVDADFMRFVPPMVERVKERIRKYVSETTDFGPTYRPSIELNDFGGLNNAQKQRLGQALQNPPNNLSVKEDDYDGRAFWVITWKQ